MISSRTWRWSGLVAVALLGCANRGMQEPGDQPDSGLGTGGLQGTGGTPGSGGAAGSPVGAGGRGGSAGTPGTGGAAGAGGHNTAGTGGNTTGTGGVAGAGGKAGAGGATTGTGGTTATGGTTGTGGTATGGVAGTGGAAGAGGKGGAAGAPATGGTTGTGGSAGSGGAAGGTAGAAGSAGAGGAAGSGAYTCPLGGALDCSTAGALKVPGGLVTDFSTPQWNATTNQFCDADGLRGRLFSFVGTATGDASTVTVDTTAQNLKLAVTAKDYVGGGLIFESCVNAAAYTSVSFTAALASGSLTGCTWQVQVQTQEQRKSTDTDPTGGTCTATNCYAYPLVGNLTAPGATATAYTELFSAFTPASSTAATRTQIVGLQWQVTSSSSNGCTAELRIDNIKFQ